MSTGEWWAELSVAAVVGTARHRVPPLPPDLGGGRPGATREAALLDAAALAGALRRAGARTHAPEPGAAADADRRQPSPARAVHLLELLLHQSPVGASLMPSLVEAWLAAADARDHHAPHHLLPELLALATRQDRLRAPLRRVADSRGVWLATANPDWRWVVDAAPASTGPLDAETWARLPTDQRVGEAQRLRGAHPQHVRDLIASTWNSDSAADRERLLAVLQTRIGVDDEPLLERALDDRSAKVRDVAVGLLDALATSARAARMAARLRPLLQVKGMLRRTLEVELPGDPDAFGVRDGLTTPKRVGSVRGWWLRRIAAAAPLNVWTEATGSGPAGTWKLVTQPDARAGIVEAVLARGDSAWASAIVVDVWHPKLLALVPPADRDAAAVRQLAVASPSQVVAVVDAVPAPWGPAFSRAILARLMSEKDPAMLVTQLTAQLATRLDPLARPALDAWATRLDGVARERVLRVSQYLALTSQIPEAFR